MEEIEFKKVNFGEVFCSVRLYDFYKDGDIILYIKKRKKKKRGKKEERRR